MRDDAVIDQLYSSIMIGDMAGVRGCFTPDARMWHNYDGVAHDLESFLIDVEKAISALPILRYDDIRRQPTPSGFVQEHMTVMTSASGALTGKPTCVVFHLSGGLIHRVHEYIDRGDGFPVEGLSAKIPGL